MSTKKKGGTRSATKKSKYKDDHLSDEEEFIQTFDVAEKLRSKEFPRFFIKELTGSEVSTVGGVKIYQYLFTSSQKSS